MFWDFIPKKYYICKNKNMDGVLSVYEEMAVLCLVSSG
jgi:pentatricopeptide repeat protein